MRVDDAGGSEESWIGDAPYSGVPVIVGHVLEQPVDGVVEITAFVDILLRTLVIDVGTHLNKIAFRHITAANVLEDEDVARFVEVGRWAELLAILIHPVGSHAVRSSVNQKRIGMRAV